MPALNVAVPARFVTTMGHFIVTVLAFSHKVLYGMRAVSPSLSALPFRVSIGAGSVFELLSAAAWPCAPMTATERERVRVTGTESINFAV